MKKAIFRIQVPLDNLVEFAWDWWHSEGKARPFRGHFYLQMRCHQCLRVPIRAAGMPVFILGPVKYLGYTFMVTTPEILLLYQRVSCLQEVINVHELEII